MEQTVAGLPLRGNDFCGYFESVMEQSIAGYHQDEEQYWVAELVCGHFQHVRHDPPWTVREWVTTAAGRESMLGYRLDCRKCDRAEPVDYET